MHFLQLLPRFRKAARSLELLQRRESWSRSEIETFQLVRLNALWASATRNVPHYRAMRERLALPARFGSLEEFTLRVPLLKKSDVRDRERGFLSQTAESGRWRWTSGSTGRPMRFYWAHHDQQEVLRCRYRFYAQWGVDIFDRVVYLWGESQGGPVARMKQRLSDRVRNRLRLPAYHVGAAALDHAIARTAAFRPAMIYGLSNAIYLFARRARETAVSLPKLQVIVTTGEVSTPRMKASITRDLGAPAVVEYGATECELIAGEADDGTLRVREDIVFVETLPRDDGRFDIVITPLANRSFPLLRYVMEDATARTLDKPARGFACLSEISGRCGDVIVAGDGSLIHPARIDVIFESDGFGAQIHAYRVHQESDGAITVWVEPSAGQAPSPAELRAQFERLVGSRMVDIRVVERLPPANQKHRIVTSQISPAGS